MQDKKLIPATFDPVFKEIFTSPDCRNYTCTLISELTSIPFEDLKNNLKVIDSRLPIDNYNEKNKTTDILLSVEGNIINIEMNNRYYSGLFERNNSYAHKVLGLTMQRGSSYKDYRFLIQINIDNFIQFKKPISVFKMMEIDTHEVENENFIIYHISLPKLSEKYYNETNLSHLEKLFLIIGLNNITDLEKIGLGDKVIMEYKSKIENLSDDEIFANLYDVEKDIEMRRKAEDLYLKEQAIKEGREKGLQEGIKEGKTEIIKNMLNENLDISLIVKVTGVSEEEINKLILQ